MGDDGLPSVAVRERVRNCLNSYFGMLQHFDAHRLTDRIIRQLPKDWFQWMYIVRQGHRCRMITKSGVREGN